MNLIVILYGLAGSGKNFVGNLIANHSNFYYWDADLILSEDMKACIAKKELFSKTMRDSFTDSVIAKLKELSENHSKIIVSQGFYRQDQRECIKNELPNSIFIQIKAEPAIIYQRLLTRDNGVNNKYADLISPYFQSDTKDRVIKNNNDAKSIIEQAKILNLISTNN